MHLRSPRTSVATLLMVSAFLVGVVGCGSSEEIAASPSASETTNGLQARLTDTAGKPVGPLQASLALVGSWSDSSDTPTHYATDSSGNMRITGLKAGEYRVDVQGDSLGASFHLVVLSDGALQSQDILVRPLATVKGRVALPAGAGRAWIQILGGAGGYWTDSLGRFSIPVAVGVAPVVIRAVVEQDTLPLGQDTLLLAPGEVRDLGWMRDPFRVGSLTFGPVPGVYENPVMFSISSKVPNVRIHYTTDGSEPGPSSPLFNAPLDIQKSTLVRAWGEKAGLRPSPQESAWVKIRVRPVEFRLISTNPLKVWIASTTNGARTRCTTDGSLPTAASPVCDTLVVQSSGWVKAIGTMDGLEDSRVDSAWYPSP